MFQQNESEFIALVRGRISDPYLAHQEAWKKIGLADGEKRSFQFFNAIHEHADATVFFFRLADKYKSDKEAGDVLAFSLRAAPAIGYHAMRDGKSVKRYRSIKTRTAAIQWLTDMGKQNGFSVLGVQVRDRGNIAVNKPGGDVFGLNEWAFTGVLTVNDVSLFEQVMKTGLGRLRAFGFGMLMVNEGA